jgi:hypothetical protein
VVRKGKKGNANLARVPDVGRLSVVLGEGEAGAFVLLGDGLCGGEKRVREGRNKKEVKDELVRATSTAICSFVPLNLRKRLRRARV